MKNFVKNKKYCGVVYVLLIAGISIFIACTGNDDIEILNDMETRQTRCVPSILNLSSYEPTKWTANDYEMMAEAAIRMGVSFSKSKNKYIYEASSGADVNIADSLYNLVKNQFELTNSIINSAGNTKVVRRKTSEMEGNNSEIPNCVPMAISNMGQNAPSYAEVVAACDSIDPGWRTKGGVDSDKVQTILNLYTPTTYRTNMNGVNSGTNLNKCVLLIDQGDSKDHAVNATQYEIRIGSDHHYHGFIYYKDHTSNSNLGDGAILVSQMTAIFTFF